MKVARNSAVAEKPRVATCYLVIYSITHDTQQQQQQRIKSCHKKSAKISEYVYVVLRIYYLILIL